MTTKKIALFGAALVALAGAATTASADSWWAYHHPRQDQVLDRVHNQEFRINQERREGELSAAQAWRLRFADWRVAQEDHRFARINGGYITPGQQRLIDHQENHVSQRIGW